MGTQLQLLKCLGMVWGRGNPKFWGLLGKNPRKSPKFGVGTGERILGIFTTLIDGNAHFQVKPGNKTNIPTSLGEVKSLNRGLAHYQGAKQISKDWDSVYPSQWSGEAHY